MVLFAGIAAEALVYGEAEGGENDKNLFRDICLLLDPPLSLVKGFQYGSDMNICMCHITYYADGPRTSVKPCLLKQTPIKEIIFVSTSDRFVPDRGRLIPTTPQC